MKFTLSFESENYSASTAESRSFGTEGVDRVRQELKVDLPIERIDNCIWQKKVGFHDSYRISEDVARKSGLFEESSNFTLRIPNGYLCHFIDEEIWYKKDSETGEIKSAGIKYVFDFDSFLRHWEDLGYPESLVEETEE